MEEPLSGSRDRRRFLLVSNGLLLLLGLALLIISIVLLASFLLAHLTFVTAQFVAAPVLGILAGSLTVAVAAYGLFLWHAKREMALGFRTLAVALFVACLLCIVECILAFLLRETIAHNFGTTKVQDQLKQFGKDSLITERWNNLQGAYECCGGGPNGYLDYTGSDGVLKEVPDSCCIQQSSGCGRTPFLSPSPIPPLEQQIYVRGCMAAIRASLNDHVMEMLLSCALIALIAALIEVLLMLSVCCFAKHVKKIKDMHRSNYSLDHGNIHSVSSPVGGGGQGPWRKGRTSFDVPQLEASPNMKQQGRHHFQPEFTSSPKHSLVTSHLSHISENGEFESFGSDDDGKQLTSLPSSGGAAAAAAAAAAAESKPGNKKGGFWSFLGWGKDGGDDGGDVMERRKEKHREDAKDREETLMKVLKNVSAPEDEGDQVALHPDEQDGKSSKDPKRGGFASFFRSKSKSKEEIPSSGEGGLRQHRSKGDRAKSLDALYQKETKEHQSGWGGWWPWGKRGDKASKDQVDDGFVEIDLGHKNAAMSDPELAHHSKGARLKNLGWFQKGQKSEDEDEVGKKKEEIRFEAAAAAAEKDRDRLQYSSDVPDHRTQSDGGAKPKYPDRILLKAEGESANIELKEAAGQPTDKDEVGGAKLKVPFWTRSRGNNEQQPKTDDEATSDVAKAMPRSRSKEREKKAASDEMDAAAAAIAAAIAVTASAAVAKKQPTAVEANGEKKTGTRLKTPSWGWSKSKVSDDGGAQPSDEEKPKDDHGSKKDKDVTKDSQQSATGAREEAKLPEAEAVTAKSAIKDATEESDGAISRLKTPAWAAARPSSRERTVSFHDEHEPHSLDPDATREKKMGEQGQQTTQSYLQESQQPPGRKLTLPAWSKQQQQPQLAANGARPKVQEPDDIPIAPVRQKQQQQKEEPHTEVKDHGAHVAVAAAAPVIAAVSSGVKSEESSSSAGGGGRKLKAPLWAARPSSRERKDEMTVVVPPKRYNRRSKSTSDEPGKRFKDPSKVRKASAGSERDVGLADTAAIGSAGGISRNAETRKSESDLFKRLPFRKPTTIGGGDDAKQRTISPPPRFSRTGSGPKSLPHSMTTPTEESKVKRAQQQREMSMSPTTLVSDEFDDFNKLRIAGFGVEKMEPKMKASPKQQQKRLPKAREVREDDANRMTLIEQEIEIDSSGGQRSSSSGDHDFMKYITTTGGYYTTTPPPPQPLREQHMQQQPQSLPKDEDAAMLERRLGDHNFMKFIQQSGGYYGHVQLPASSAGYRKWKEDKVSRELHEEGSEEDDLLRGGKMLESSKRHRSSSESSIETDGRRLRLRQPQFYLNKTDGRILATFESSPHQEELFLLDRVHLPFGPPTQQQHLEYGLEPELSYLEEDSRRRRRRSDRARSEPRFRHQHQQQQPQRAEEQQTQSLTRRSKSGDRHRNDPTRHMYRTTLEVESVGDGRYDVRSPFEQQHVSSLRLPAVSASSQQQQPVMFERRTVEREIPRSPRRHVSVTTMHVGADPNVRQ